VSQIDADELLRAIGSVDVTRLQSARGVGKKTAERIVVELKDKVADYAVEHGRPAVTVLGTAAGVFNDAQEALFALGLPRKEAARMIEQVRRNGDSANWDASAIVKEALRNM
jgi:Holliday junction DNA helicase RuvA